MAKSPKTKEERIELRVKPQDKRSLEKAAQAQGLSLSSYLVSRSLTAAHETRTPYRTAPTPGSLPRRVPVDDPILNLGREPGHSGVKTVSEDHDKHLYDTR